jgi:hypothetical protein
MVREEFIAEATGLLGDSNIHELSDERFVGTLVYPVADPAGATLTVREREADPPVTLPGLAWRLVDDHHVEITRPTASGFDHGAIFEFIYRARDPLLITAIIITGTTATTSTDSTRVTGEDITPRGAPRRPPRQTRPRVTEW